MKEHGSTVGRGARAMGSFVPLGEQGTNRHSEQLRKVKTLHTTAERCSDCTWPEICRDDTTCWDQERRLLRDVDAYRKQERRDQLAAASANGDENVHLHPAAEEQADELLDQLSDGLAGGIVIEVDRELDPANARLIRSLGADYKVTPKTKRRKQWTRETIIEAIQAFANEHGRPPTVLESTRAHGLPRHSTVRKVFGSWAAGIEAAGFEKPMRSRRVRPLEGAAAPAGREPAAPSSGSSSEAKPAGRGGPDEAAADESATRQVEVAGSIPASRSSLARAALLKIAAGLTELADALYPETPTERRLR